MTNTNPAGPKGTRKMNHCKCGKFCKLGQIQCVRCLVTAVVVVAAPEATWTVLAVGCDRIEGEPQPLRREVIVPAVPAAPSGLLNAAKGRWNPKTWTLGMRWTAATWATVASATVAWAAHIGLIG